VEGLAVWQQLARALNDPVSIYLEKKEVVQRVIDDVALLPQVEASGALVAVNLRYFNGRLDSIQVAELYLEFPILSLLSHTQREQLGGFVLRQLDSEHQLCFFVLLAELHLLLAVQLIVVAQEVLTLALGVEEELQHYRQAVLDLQTGQKRKGGLVRVGLADLEQRERRDWLRDLQGLLILHLTQNREVQPLAHSQLWILPEPNEPVNHVKRQPNVLLNIH